MNAVPTSQPSPAAGLSAGQTAEILCLCQQLVARTSWLGDAGDGDGYARCFTDDGIFDRAGTEIQGQEALTAYVASRPTGVVVRHFNATPYIEVHSVRAASGIVLSTVWRRDEDGSTHTVMAEIRDEYRRTHEGWRIAKRTAQPVS